MKLYFKIAIPEKDELLASLPARQLLPANGNGNTGPVGSAGDTRFKLSRIFKLEYPFYNILLGF
ncbi:MAG: hypothetical protein R6U96_08170 [Promethearchaeia archaeon]